jgi:metal-sulfur cluster biosynthetic enzyme
MSPWSKVRPDREEGSIAAPDPVSSSEASVLEALRPIVDPDSGRSIVDLGFVKNIAINGPCVAFEIELTTPACPVKAEFKKAARERVLALAGVSEVNVTMAENYGDLALYDLVEAVMEFAKDSREAGAVIEDLLATGRIRLTRAS